MVKLIQEHALLVRITLSMKSHPKWHLTLFFLSILTPALSVKSRTRLERYSKVARCADNVSSLRAQVHFSHPQQFVCPSSLDCSFLSSPFYFVTMTTISKWVAHISHSLSSFIFYFSCSDFHLSVFSTHSPTLSCTIIVTLTFPLFRLTPIFSLFLTTTICGTDLCSVFFTSVCYKIFMLHCKHLHHILWSFRRVRRFLFFPS